ncbi:MAG TPA: hypothetical protein VFE98_07450 [Candidatus Bathyarchaeia archaeon]|nr:hypothetical protein [Candidatus Bathyarchaeia archaeon]
MTLTYACIAPHGSEAIPALASDRLKEKFAPTTAGMRTIAREAVRARPDVLVIATPHNLRLSGQIGVVLAENSSGSLKGSGNRQVSVHAKCEVKFAKTLLNHAQARGLPVVGANYGTSEGLGSNMPMDWGTLVPLWFVFRAARSSLRIVIVTPSREIALKKNFVFGKIIARLIQSRPQSRFVFIASADQAHAHQKSGLYGFHSAAAKYDELVQSAVKTNNLKSLMHLDPGLVEDAKPDSLWQLAMLAGVTEVVPTRSELISYQVPTYYGLACASFYPKVTAK